MSFKFKSVLTLILASISTLSFANQESACVIPHEECQEFSRRGTCIKNISEGASQYEVWHSHIDPGFCTPKHSHETEEIFVFFKGSGWAIVGGEKIEYEAPCTLILPANVEHQIFSAGEETTDHLAIIGHGSAIFNDEGSLMHLPWRSTDEE